jgi:hypothetical protein
MGAVEVWIAAMRSNAVPGSPLWISVVALIALLNVVLLLFVSRNYFAARASRAKDRRSDLEPAPAVGEHFYGAPDGFTEAASDDGFPLASTAEGGVAPIVTTTASEAPASSKPILQGSARHATTAATDAPIEDVLEAARIRIEKHPGSSEALKDLLRALYLDQSMFTFSILAEMPAEDRALAGSLVEAWLMDAYPVERWEGVYKATQEGLAPGLSFDPVGASGGPQFSAGRG